MKKEMEKINYVDMLDSANFSSDYRANMINLMNMGFMDFNKNLVALQKNFNNLELTCSHIINKYWETQWNILLKFEIQTNHEL